MNYQNYKTIYIPYLKNKVNIKIKQKGWGDIMKEWEKPKITCLGIGKTESISKDPLGIRPLGKNESSSSSSSNKPPKPPGLGPS